MVLTPKRMAAASTRCRAVQQKILDSILTVCLTLCVGLSSCMSSLCLLICLVISLEPAYRWANSSIVVGEVSPLWWARFVHCGGRPSVVNGCPLLPFLCHLLVKTGDRWCLVGAPTTLVCGGFYAAFDLGFVEAAECLRDAALSPDDIQQIQSGTTDRQHHPDRGVGLLFFENHAWL